MTLAPAGRRPPVTPTNSLILLLPEALFAPQLLPLFEAHFGSYGSMVSWTALERLGRVLAVYEDVESATDARLEMDGFVWEDEAEQDRKREAHGVVVVDGGVQIQSDAHAAEFRTPLRVFFGPQLALPLASVHSTLLSVPALSKNFLISPPGSPPVGWEQTLEEAPNSQPHADDVLEGTEDAGAGWADELARALRFLSVSGGGDDEEVEEDMSAHERMDDQDEPEQMTQVVVPPHLLRPAVTVSTPTQSSARNSGPGTPTPPPGAHKITAVKATIESLLGRKRSSSDLRSRSSSEDGLVSSAGGGFSLGGGAIGGGLGAGSRITPTARPPVAPEREFTH